MSKTPAMYPLAPTLRGDVSRRDNAMWDGATAIAKKKTPWGPVRDKVTEAKVPDLGALSFYHGTAKAFDGAIRIGAGDRDGHMDAGPGVYFTTNPEQASGYAHGDGGRVFRTKIQVDPARVLTKTVKNSRSKVARLIKSAPADHQTDLAMNFGHEAMTPRAFEDVVDQYHHNYDNFMDAAHVLHRDLFHRDTRAWTAAMTKVGYDGAYVEKEAADMSKPDRPLTHYAHHFVAYNPKVVKTPGVLESCTHYLGNPRTYRPDDFHATLWEDSPYAAAHVFMYHVHKAGLHPAYEVASTGSTYVTVEHPENADGEPGAVIGVRRFADHASRADWGAADIRTGEGHDVTTKRVLDAAATIKRRAGLGESVSHGASMAASGRGPIFDHPGVIVHMHLADGVPADPASEHFAKFRAAAVKNGAAYIGGSKDKRVFTAQFWPHDNDETMHLRRAHALSRDLHKDFQDTAARVRMSSTFGDINEAVDLDALIAKHRDRMVGGKGDHKDPSKVDRKQLAAGVKVELEHTKDPARALEIALDHLAEKPDYYSRLSKAGLVDEAEDRYGKRVNDNMAHMKTHLGEWSAVPFAMTVDQESGRQVPQHDFSSVRDYKNAPSLYANAGSTDTACELCGKAPIKNIYHACHHGNQWMMAVGSECIGKFHPEGKSGEDLEREALEAHAKDTLKRLHGLAHLGSQVYKTSRGFGVSSALLAHADAARKLYRTARENVQYDEQNRKPADGSQGREFNAVKWYGQNGKKAEAILAPHKDEDLSAHVATANHSWMDWKKPAAKPVSESATTSVADHVKTALAPHVPAWREATRAAYRDHADDQLARHTAFFKDKAEDWRPTDRNRSTGRYNDAPPRTGLVSVPRDDYSVHPYAHHVAAAKAGTSAADYALADKGADAQFNDIHDTFVARAAEKLTHMAGTRGIRSVSVDVHHAGGALHGRIRGHIDDHSHIDIDAETHTNYRYGDNAADGQLTQYTQYPFRVLGAQDGGKPIAVASADDVARHFGGVAKSAHDAAVRTASKAARATSKAQKLELGDGAKNLRDVAAAIKAHGKAHDDADAAADPAHPGHAKIARELEKSYQQVLSMNPHLRDGGFTKAAPTTVYPRPGGARIVPDTPIDPVHPVAAGGAAARDRKSGILTRADVLRKHGYTTWPTSEEVKAHVDRLKAELAAIKSPTNESTASVKDAIRAHAAMIGKLEKKPVFATHYRVPAGTPEKHWLPIAHAARDIDAPGEIKHHDGSTTYVHVFDNRQDAADHLAAIRAHVAKLHGPKESVLARLNAILITNIGMLD